MSSIIFPEILGALGETLVFIVKQHVQTNICIKLIQDGYKTFANLLQSRTKDKCRFVLVGSSNDGLHMSRLITPEDGAPKPFFFPELDFDMDMVYDEFVVAEDDGDAVAEAEGTKTSPSAGGDAKDTDDETRAARGEHEIKHSDESKKLQNLNLENESKFDEKCSQDPFTGSGSRDAKGALNISQELKDGEINRVPFAYMEPIPGVDGYVKLQVTEQGRKLLPDYKLAESVNAEGFLSHEMYFRQIRDKATGTEEYSVIYQRDPKDFSQFVRSGPAISFLNNDMTDQSYDFVHAFPCRTWPKMAARWPDRARQCGWPSEDTIQDILQEGCLIVPVSSHQATDSTHWKVSFVLAEATLARSLTEWQQTCYCVTKLLLKSCLTSKGILTTYMMKNIFFYLCEETPSPDEWSQENLGNLIIKFLKYIAVCLHVKRVPAYFFPPLNLIGHFEESEIDLTKSEMENILKEPYKSLSAAYSSTQTLILPMNKFSNLGGHAQYIVGIYTGCVQLLWKLADMNVADYGAGRDLAEKCYSMIVYLNFQCKPYISMGSKLFSSMTVPELIYDDAILCLQAGDTHKALGMFVIIENCFKKNPNAKVDYNIFLNIACIYTIQITESIAGKSYHPWNWPEPVTNTADLALLYYQKAMTNPQPTTSMHMSFGNCLKTCGKTSQAMEQFLLAIECLHKEDEASFLGVTFPGADPAVTEHIIVPAQVTAFYHLVQHSVDTNRTHLGRRVANKFLIYVHEKVPLPEKVGSLKLCSISLRCTGLSFLGEMTFTEAERWEKALKQSEKKKLK